MAASASASTLTKYDTLLTSLTYEDAESLPYASAKDIYTKVFDNEEYMAAVIQSAKIMANKTRRGGVMHSVGVTKIMDPCSEEKAYILAEYIAPFKLEHYYKQYILFNDKVYDWDYYVYCKFEDYDDEFNSDDKALIDAVLKGNAQQFNVRVQNSPVDNTEHFAAMY